MNWYLLALVGASLAERAPHFEFVPHGEADEHVVSEGVARSYKVISQTYHSQAFPLLPGQMLFSNPGSTPVPLPDGRFAILGIHGDIAKQDGKGNYVAAPVTEVYDHHWILIDSNHQNRLCPEGPNYVFGIGAESRDTPVRFPKGHGYVVEEDSEWGANIHLLRIDSGKDLLGDNPWVAGKECAECFYSPAGTKGSRCTPKHNGTFQCCGDNCYDGSCFCPTKPNTPQVARKYVLRYTLRYTRDLDAIVPISVGVFTTPSCNVFYEVYENNTDPESLSSTTFRMKADAEIMLAVGHLHTGGINISLSLNGRYICTSYPGYGTEPDKPGNELGHLVSMTPCRNSEENDGLGLQVKKGDKLRLDGWYWVGAEDKRISPSPGGTHLNVMAYMYTAYKVGQLDMNTSLLEQVDDVLI